MVLYTLEYYIKPETVKEYMKFSKEVSLPYWMSLPGLTEFGGYRDDATGKVLLTIKFESYKAWGKAMDNPKTLEIGEKFRSYTKGMSWKLWGASPIIPEPLKPSK